MRAHLNILILSLILLSTLTFSTSHAESFSQLGRRMHAMSTAMMGLQHPGTVLASKTPMDDLKILKDAAVDCRDNSATLAPPEVAANSAQLAAFHSAFVMLVSKIEVLETALQLPADDANRAAKIKSALDGVNAVKTQGHMDFAKHP